MVLEVRNGRLVVESGQADFKAHYTISDISLIVAAHLMRGLAFGCHAGAKVSKPRVKDGATAGFSGIDAIVE